MSLTDFYATAIPRQMPSGRSAFPPTCRSISAATSCNLAANNVTWRGSLKAAKFSAFESLSLKVSPDWRRNFDYVDNVKEKRKGSYVSFSLKFVFIKATRFPLLRILSFAFYLIKKYIVIKIYSYYTSKKQFR